jgi:nucleoside permease NupC
VAAGGEYSGNQLAAQSAFLIFWMAVMVGLGRIVLRVLAALAAHSLVGRCVVAALVLHVAASLLAAALLPPPAKRSRRSSNGASVASGSAVGASSESEKEL